MRTLRLRHVLERLQSAEEVAVVRACLDHGDVGGRVWDERRGNAEVVGCGEVLHVLEDGGGGGGREE